MGDVQCTTDWSKSGLSERTSRTGSCSDTLTLVTNADISRLYGVIPLSVRPAHHNPHGQDGLGARGRLLARVAAAAAAVQQPATRNVAQTPPRSRRALPPS